MNQKTQLSHLSNELDKEAIFSEKDIHPDDK